MEKLNWDDLRYFLAAVQAGSYTAAADQLGVNRTTIGRRIQALETCLGMSLFEQTASGYHPTDAGRIVLEAAGQIELRLDAMEERLALAGQRLHGPLRLALPHGFEEVLTAEIVAFAHQYPGVKLELLAANDPLASVMERKADVGICLVDNQPQHTSGVHIAELTRAVYGAKKYLRTHRGSLSQHQWIGWNEEISDVKLSSWMTANLPAETEIVVQANSLTSLSKFVLSGLGVAFLWSFIADREKSLSKIYSEEKLLNMNIWLLRLEDIPPSARVTALMEFIAPLVLEKVKGAFD